LPPAIAGVARSLVVWAINEVAAQRASAIGS
jgi:hypothetical protein